MFRRIKATWAVLTAPTDHEILREPGSFERSMERLSRREQVVARVSSAVVFGVLGYNAAKFAAAAIPSSETLGVVGIVGGIVGVLIAAIYRTIHHLILELVTNSRIGHAFSPHFGHKLSSTLRVLKG